MIPQRHVVALGVALGLLAVALAAGAQQAPKIHRVGFLVAGGRPSPLDPAGEAFMQELRELGYVEGQNLIMESRYAEDTFERLPTLAAELVSIGVDVIAVAGPGPIRAARDATRAIPIVMIAGSSDPVAEGLVASLARPGGNLTGLTYAVSPERFGKQLELLKRAVGRLSRVAILWDLDLTLFRERWAQPLSEAARGLSLQLQDPVQVRGSGQLSAAFETMVKQRADAVFVVMGGPAYQQRGRVAELAVRNRLPAIAAFREFPLAGGLMSYGPDLPDLYRRGARYIDRVLKGAKPADLPIEQPAKFELVINLKTARTLGIVIPPSVLVQADHVIDR